MIARLLLSVPATSIVVSLEGLLAASGVAAERHAAWASDMQVAHAADAPHPTVPAAGDLLLPATQSVRASFSLHLTHDDGPDELPALAMLTQFCGYAPGCGSPAFRDYVRASTPCPVRLIVFWHDTVRAHRLDVAQAALQSLRFASESQRCIRAHLSGVDTLIEADAIGDINATTFAASMPHAVH